MKNKAYSYIRFSTPKQRDGDSIRRQTELTRKYADEHNLDLDETLTFQDCGVSAYKGKHVEVGQLGAFIKAIEDGRIQKGSVLIVESMDRLSRQVTTDAITTLIKILKLGVEIVSLEDNRRFSNDSLNSGPTDFMITAMQLMRGNSESVIKSHRLKESWGAKRAQATNKIITSICCAWLRHDKENNQFVVNKERAKVIRRIFQYSKEGYGSSWIQTRLNNSKVPTFGRSHGWHKSYIEKILTNRSVIGEYQPHMYVNGKRVPEGEPIVNYYPSVVDMELFEIVQLKRKKRRIHGKGRVGKNISNLFTSIATCGYCGSNMVFVNKGVGTKGGKSLVCGNAMRGLGCNYISWKYSDFEATFLSFVREISSESAFLNETDGKLESLKREIYRYEVEHDKHRSSLHKLLRLIQDENDPPKILIQNMKEIEVIMNVTAERIQELRDSLFELNQQEQSVLSINTITNTSGDYTVRKKQKENIADLIDNITVRAGGLVRTLEEDRNRIADLNIEAATSYDSELRSHFQAMKPSSYKAKKSGRSYSIRFKNGCSRVISFDGTKYVSFDAR